MDYSHNRTSGDPPEFDVGRTLTEGRFLRVALLADRITVHNACFETFTLTSTQAATWSALRLNMRVSVRTCRKCCFLTAASASGFAPRVVVAPRLPQRSAHRVEWIQHVGAETFDVGGVSGDERHASHLGSRSQQSIDCCNVANSIHVSPLVSNVLVYVEQTIIERAANLAEP
jgi:hypothetical protein